MIGFSLLENHKETYNLLWGEPNLRSFLPLKEALILPMNTVVPKDIAPLTSTNMANKIIHEYTMNRRMNWPRRHGNAFRSTPWMPSPRNGGLVHHLKLRSWANSHYMRPFGRYYWRGFLLSKSHSGPRSCWEDGIKHGVECRKDLTTHSWNPPSQGSQHACYQDGTSREVAQWLCEGEDKIHARYRCMYGVWNIWK